MLLWLWCRPVATAPIGTLAWEPPCAMGAALEKDKKKNPTAEAWVTAEAQAGSLAQRQGLKDPVLPQLQHRLQLWLRFTPWPESFHMPWAQPLKNKC